MTTETFTFTYANALNVIDGTSRVVLLPQISNTPLVNLERERKLQISASYSLFNGLTIYFLVDLIMTSKSNQLH